METQTIIDPTALDAVARTFVSGLSFVAKQRFNGRLERGLDIAKIPGAILPSTTYPHRYTVLASDGIKRYQVDLVTHTCECPDSQKGNHCKHRIAAYYVEQALKAQPVHSDPPKPAAPKADANQILKELGFEPDKKSDRETPPAPLKLGSLYRHYLNGADLQGKGFPVTIDYLTRENENQWCLWVRGLPEGMPTGILFGPRDERDLVRLFGPIDIASLPGKALTLFPEEEEVAGKPRTSIRFRRAK